MKGSVQPRQLFVATLLAAAVVTLTSARPLLSPSLARGRSSQAAEHRAVRLYAEHRETLRDSIASLARAQLGKRYVLGGTTPHSGFDCSGLVRYVFSRMYWTPPRTARLQARAGTPIDRTALMPGDVLTFGEGGGVSHVGIYVGGGMYVHASSVAGRVVMSAMDRRPSKL